MAVNEASPAGSNRRYSATIAVFSNFFVVAAMASQVRAKRSMVLGFYGIAEAWA
jgi:hypothetical protein